VRLTLLGVVVIYVAALALVFQWQALPFIGAFVEPNLVFNDVGSLEAPPWPAFNPNGVQPADKLVSVNGQPVASTSDLAAALSQHAPGNTIQLQVAGPSTPAHDVTVTLERFSHLGTYFVVPFFIGLVYLLVGLAVFRLRHGEPAGQTFAFFCLMVAATLGTQFDIYTTHLLAWAWTIAIPLAGGTLITLGLLFPQEMKFVRKQPLLSLVGYVPAVLIALNGLYSLYFSADPRAYYVGWRYGFIYMGLGAVLFLSTVAYRWRFSRSPVVREQSRLILIGSLLAFGLIVYWAVPLLWGAISSFNQVIYLPPLVFFPLFAAYAILRYRLLSTDRVVSRGLVYFAVGVVTLIAYLLILAGLSLVGTIVLGMNTLMPIRADNPVGVVLLVLVLLLAFNPVRDWFQRYLDEVFFRGSRAYSQHLEQFGRELTRAATLADVHAALQGLTAKTLRPAHFHLFLREAASNEFAAYRSNPATSAPATPTTDVHFAADGPLATLLTETRSPVHLSPEIPFPVKLQSERTRLALLGAAIYSPLMSKNGLAGWLAVGPKLSGEPYTGDDVRFAEALGDQSALAIERATVISDLEQRVQELNVLSQLSQAVNFTTAYDDLLELIYAQTSKIVDTRHFFIILRDLRHQVFSSVFYVENNDRLDTEENKPWVAGQGLESEIIRTGRPLRTDNYVAECRRRSVAPGPKDFKAWMGVPLNTGAQTIGVASLGSYEPGVVFTDEQLKIFAAIADQAASALIKAQLVRQADQRARQLATLNEVSTSMGSMLEFEPLLQRIVQSSVDILACQAGSLFLIDDESGDYIFKVAVGPVGQNLVGMRLKPGRGFVGEAIQSGQPLVVNDVQSDSRWFKGSDESTGFITRALMVVPLRRAEKVIGALEVINKADGTEFDDEDQSLLSAFSGPATIAIENARLFTYTDQALAARVDELFMMQRIDRELNATLDVKRVMSIALDWAMKNTGAVAGSIGSVGETGITIIATQGYSAEAEPAEAPVWPLDYGIMGRVVRTGELSLVRDVKLDPDYRGSLPTTECQLTIPLKRESEVLGLLTLESPDRNAFTEDQAAFATRLMDHAAVALTNARLYAQVQAANLAKSEFVSFVAHELKTPMTSIKGFADLILGGAVGPINDMQKQFLGTIRNNVERMATLVSDLSDVARLESGRMRLEMAPVDFGQVVEEVVRSTRSMVEGKKQKLIQILTPELPAVQADQIRLSQVLTNLVSNAHKYTPEGGEIVLMAVCEPTAGNGQVLHVSVKDNGIGIAPEDQKKLFQKFFRAEDRLAREMAPGTGLGLNIVKNLVELQGGRIWFESEYRQGSTFHFTLPLAPEPAAA
jgi:signal transduction histidine kinase